MQFVLSPLLTPSTSFLPLFPILQVETDKVTIDVPYTGPPAKVTQVYVSVGDSVTVGQGVCEITTEGVEAAPAVSTRAPPPYSTHLFMLPLVSAGRPSPTLT